MDDEGIWVGSGGSPHRSACTQTWPIRTIGKRTPLAPGDRRPIEGTRFLFYNGITHFSCPMHHIDPQQQVQQPARSCSLSMAVRRLRCRLLRLVDPRILVVEVQVAPQVARPRMTLKVLGPAGPPAEPPQLTARLVRQDLLVRLRLEVLAHPQTARVPARLARRQDVVRPDALEERDLLARLRLAHTLPEERESSEVGSRLI